MKKSVPLLLLAAALWVFSLFFSYVVVFAFYVAGLFGDGSSVPVKVWDRAMRATMILGTPLSVFLVLGAIAWQARWSAGLLPWVAGALAVLLLARYDAGILHWADFFWVVPLLYAAWFYWRKREKDG